MKDQLPAGVTFQSASVPTTVYDSGTGIWNVGSLTHGSSATLTITATVNSGTVGTKISNKAAITAEDQFDATPGDDSSSADINVIARTKLYSFGLNTNAPPTGYTRVLPNDTYTAAHGYGWTAPTTGFDNGTPSDPLLSEGQRTKDDTFKVDLPNGNYWVTFTVGETKYSHGNMNVIVGSTTIYSGLSTGVGQFLHKSFPTTVSGGQLAIEFKDTNSIDSVALNGLTIRPAPVSGIVWSASNPTSLMADGSSTATIVGTTPLPAGSFVTIITTIGTITSADANANYIGTQVKVDASHQITFVVKAGTALGIATITAQEITGSDSDSTTLQMTMPPLRKYDFNAPGSPSAAGYLGVLPGDVYSAIRGYGWKVWGTGFDRGAGHPDALREDGLTGADNTFRVQIDPTAASYTITVYYGDYSKDHLGQNTITVGGLAPDNVAGTAANVFQTYSKTIPQASFPPNGILDVRFQNSGANGLALNGLEIATPLEAETVGVPLATAVPALTQAELIPVVREAVTRWLRAGVDAATAVRLESTTVQVANLSSAIPGTAGYLGLTGTGVIQIDATAAGRGWFIDPTLADDREFSQTAHPGELFADRASPAYGHYDLLTVVMHELGHLANLPDLDPRTSPDNLMSEVLPLNSRRIPLPKFSATSREFQALVQIIDPLTQNRSANDWYAGRDSQVLDRLFQDWQLLETNANNLGRRAIDLVTLLTGTPASSSGVGGLHVQPLLPRSATEAGSGALVTRRRPLDRGRAQISRQAVVGPPVEALDHLFRNGWSTEGS